MYYYVATLARYVLVEAQNEADARARGHAALHDLYADLRERLGKEVPINIATIRPATDKEIELWRWHQEMVAGDAAQTLLMLISTPLVDPEAQAKTDWVPMSVPGRENADGTETPTAWFAYNRATRQSIEFGSFEEARDFCFHPDNCRPIVKAPIPGNRIRLVSMRDDPNPIEAGQIGTVTGVSRHGAGADAWHQIEVAWDNGRTLMLLSPPDAFEIIGNGRQ